MQRLTFRSSYSMRDRLGKGLMLLAALGALTAFIGSIGAVGGAGSDTQQVEIWRMFGFVLFTGLFLLLAVAPGKYPGLWELLIVNKAALTLAEVVIARNDATAAAASAAIDGVLTLLILAAYVLCRGYESWQLRPARPERGAQVADRFMHLSHAWGPYPRDRVSSPEGTSPRRRRRSTMSRPVIAVVALALATLISPPPAEAASWRHVTSVSHPMGLAIDLRGKPASVKWAYTLDYYANRVVKFGTGGKQLGSWSYSPETLYKLGGGVAVGGAGNVFVADGTGGRVLKFDPFGKKLAQFGPFQLPRAVAVDGTGNIYVAEQRGLRVTKLSPSGTLLARWNTPWVNGQGSSAPFAIALDRQGNVFVAVSCQADSCQDDHGDTPKAVLKLNSSGVTQSSLVGGTPHGGWSRGEEPWVVLDSITVDHAGNLYVAGLLRGTPNSLSYGVLVYASGSHRTARYTLPGWGALPGLAIDGTGTLYVAQDGGILSLRK